MAADEILILNCHYPDEELTFDLTQSHGGLAAGMSCTYSVLCEQKESKREGGRGGEREKERERRVNINIDGQRLLDLSHKLIYCIYDIYIYDFLLYSTP